MLLGVHTAVAVLLLVHGKVMSNLKCSASAVDVEGHLSTPAKALLTVVPCPCPCPCPCPQKSQSCMLGPAMLNLHSAYDPIMAS